MVTGQNATLIKACAESQRLLIKILEENAKSLDPTYSTSSLAVRRQAGSGSLSPSLPARRRAASMAGFPYEFTRARYGIAETGRRKGQDNQARYREDEDVQPGGGLGQARV